MEGNFKKLEKTLNINFINKELLSQAFVHRSFLNEHRGAGMVSNERLEFLGDSVLNFVVSRYLYRTYPTHPEGDLTNFRASIVKTNFLSKISESLKFGSFILISRGEEESGGRKRETILADTLEAFLGALFLDQKIEACEEFVQKNIVPYLSEIIENKTYRDYKSRLQEFTQTERDGTPSYRVLSMEGPDHNRLFRIGVFVHSKLMGEGTGKSKQEAEQEAAKGALAKLKVP